MKCKNAKCGFIGLDYVATCQQCNTELRDVMDELGLVELHPATPYYLGALLGDEEVGKRPSVSKKVAAAPSGEAGLEFSLEDLAEEPAPKPAALKKKPAAPVEETFEEFGDDVTIDLSTDNLEQFMADTAAAPTPSKPAPAKEAAAPTPASDTAESVDQALGHDFGDLDMDDLMGELEGAEDTEVATTQKTGRSVPSTAKATQPARKPAPSDADATMAFSDDDLAPFAEAAPDKGTQAAKKKVPEADEGLAVDLADEDLESLFDELGDIDTEDAKSR